MCACVHARGAACLPAPVGLTAPATQPALLPAAAPQAPPSAAQQRQLTSSRWRKLTQKITAARPSSQGGADGCRPAKNAAMLAPVCACSMCVHCPAMPACAAGRQAACHWQLPLVLPPLPACNSCRSVWRHHPLLLPAHCVPPSPSPTLYTPCCCIPLPAPALLFCLLPKAHPL
jgi:hypothetical protein